MCRPALIGGEITFTLDLAPNDGIQPTLGDATIGILVMLLSASGLILLRRQYGGRYSHEARGGCHARPAGHRVVSAEDHPEQRRRAPLRGYRAGASPGVPASSGV